MPRATAPKGNIPAGYQIHFRTWENDGDNYKTQIISGLTVEDAHFYVSLAKNFERNSHGNELVPTKDLVAMINTAFEKHPKISSSLREKFTFEGVPEGSDDYDFLERFYEFL